MNEQEFVEELKKIGIDITSNQLNRLEKFYNFLIEKNKVMNLTRIVEKKEVYLKHFYDSLTLYRVIDLNKNISVCDVGTGAGFPGIVLKIVFPNLKVTLIDSLQKRINYLNELINELELQDIVTIHTRSEDYAKDNREKFDVVTSRAVANLKVLSEITIPMVKVNGLFVAMKSNIEEEINESKKILKELKSEIINIEKFELPIEKSLRNIVVVQKKDKTPNIYPRRMDKIKNLQ